MAKERDKTAEVTLARLSSPRIFLVRMLVFLILCGLIVIVLNKQIWTAFLANPGLNGLIIAVLIIGIILTFRQVMRLAPEVAWVNSFRIADPGLAQDRQPVLLAPMAAILGDRVGRMAISQQTMRHLLDSIATRLDESRDISRYMTGLLVFLGLLGTFWGLIETVGSIGKVIEGLQVGGEAGSVFDALKDGLARPLAGMGISFSSSLFGLAGSLVLGFLDLQAGQAQNRFYTDLEDWLAGTVGQYTAGDGAPIAAAAPGTAAMSAELRTAIDKLRTSIEDGGSGKTATTAMANLAEAIQGLVQHMRAEQQMIREWADTQGEQGKEIKKLLEVLTREKRETLMALARGRRSERGFDYWPGFVDALSTLILGIIFLLSVFVVVQFFLSQEVTTKDQALDRLNAQISQLTQLLSLEKTGKITLEDTIAQMRASLAAAESERDRVKGLYDGLAGAGSDAGSRATELGKALDSEKQVSQRAMAQIELLNQQISALRRQLAALEDALDVSEKRDRESQARVADLGQPPQCRAGAARAGIVALPLGFLRPAARHSRQPSRHPHRRRPLRVPVGSLLRHRTGDSSARRAGRTRQARNRLDRSRSADSLRSRMGAARRRPHRRAPDQVTAIPLQLGIVLGTCDLGGAVSDLEGCLAATARRGGLWRIPAA